jgi:ketosteroid isomerase-like protein
MGSTAKPLEVVQTAYAAFGRGDLPAILNLVSENVDWKFIGSRGLPYTGIFRTKNEVAKWFASIPEADDIQAFEPREFINGGEHVTVLGWERTRALPSGKVFESEWTHVFTVRDGRVVRFWGMYDTEASAAARA